MWVPGIRLVQGGRLSFRIFVFHLEIPAYMARIALLSLAFCGRAVVAPAQNMTDSAVMDDKSADSRVLNIGTEPPIADSVFLHPDRIRYDHRCFQIEGRDVFIFSGTFQYFRVPRPLWADRFRKLKAAGFNCVETYVPWNWHEREMPRSLDDESHIDLGDMVAFLRMAEDFGLYVILRPGPYICAEWSGGGFPQWLLAKKPKALGDKVWLQSDEPEFMRWNEHWYRAVCRAAAPHQLTEKPAGGAGIILFQVENEYNRVKWFPREAKRNCLERLAGMARKYGIEVPVITCWTDESRNAGKGALDGAVDMVNSYPRWQVERSFGRLVNLQMKTQPGKPLVSGELQGGWAGELGQPLPWEQDGLAPVQTQNIALYALERGFCALNFYAAVGGTNFDDWAARQQTASYDFAAAIGEGETTNERYRRFQGLSAFIREHGTRIARADLDYVPYTSTDDDVKLAVRTSPDGDRYYFIRTEEHSRQHFGTICVQGLALDFALEPFGAMAYYLPSGAKEGTWYPRLPEPQARVMRPLPPVELKREGVMADRLPSEWTWLRRGGTVDDDGIYGRHFIYYRASAYRGCTLEVGRTGKDVMNRSAADTVLVAVDGELVPIDRETPEKACYRIPGDSAGRQKADVLLLFESRGLHHHTNAAVEEHWKTGPAFVRSRGENLPLRYAYTEKAFGERWSAGGGLPLRDSVSRRGNPLLKWHFYSFETAGDRDDLLYFLRLEHSGNGFVYVNGHCIGRCYQEGPQREYYMPECWLRQDRPNRVAVSLRPCPQGNDVESASVVLRSRGPDR